MPTTLLLASGSRYKRQLLERLRVPFHVYSPDVDESPQAGEAPQGLVTRLAALKARTVAAQFAESLVIGADQVAVCGGLITGKPGNAARCAEQLRNASGQSVSFLTAVCLYRENDQLADAYVDTTVVRFRTLTEAEIARYIELEQPFDCAGGFKAEGLGISLFDSIESHDPTALIGLPLIWLAGALRRAGAM